MRKCLRIFKTTINLEIKIMKNFKKLSREELKNTFGGQSCTLTIQGADGSWITRTGTCQKLMTSQIGDSAVEIAYAMATASSYCETGLGPVAVTSNGGRSRC